jgi:hypothetical protein
MKILIIGHGGHGKDALADIWEKYFGLTHISSSVAANHIFLFNDLKDIYGYKTHEECFNDRVNKRAEWYDRILEYNKDNKARLAGNILKKVDCYVGMRNKEEFDECVKQKLFDIIIWIDASKRLKEEPNTSFTIDKSHADIIIENNDSYEDFEKKAIRIGKIIFKK